MQTIIRMIENNENFTQIIKEGVKYLKNGGLVAFPTETVYGLGANALCENASKKIYYAKGRPSDNPLIVHVSKDYDLYKLVKDIPEKAKLLINAFWPGPLTIIFNKNNCISNTITGGLSTIAIRIPSHPIAYQLIEQSGLPIVAPSANLSGRPSPTQAQHVIDDLNGKIDMIIDGGNVKIGLESTVIDITSAEPIILRPGFITKEMIEQIIGDVNVDKTLLNVNTSQIPKSPGMKYKHYAPKGELFIVKGQLDKVTYTINQLVMQKEQEGYKVGIIATKQSIDSYKRGIIKNIGNRNNQEEIAKHLFAILRELDQIGVDYIYVEAFNNKDFGQAIMNRLIKAAGYKVINTD